MSLIWNLLDYLTRVSRVFGKLLAGVWQAIFINVVRIVKITNANGVTDDGRRAVTSLKLCLCSDGSRPSFILTASTRM